MLGLALVLAIISRCGSASGRSNGCAARWPTCAPGAATVLRREQPLEIQPLVSNSTALLAQNAENLDRARRHVANLAHGLKTPLATLAIALSKPAATATANCIRWSTLMERRIRHHLGRARAAALSGPVRTRTLIAPRIDDLGDVLAKVHAERKIALSIDVSRDLAVACERRISTRWRATSWRTLSSGRACASLCTPGFIPMTTARAWCSPSRTMAQACGRTRWRKCCARANGSTKPRPDFGFGLSITRELAELYGGAVELAASPSGGLRVLLTLPLASRDLT